MTTTALITIDRALTTTDVMMACCFPIPQAINADGDTLVGMLALYFNCGGEARR
jgi:hypothetical protein